jgi:hypothetical protein
MRTGWWLFARKHASRAQPPPDSAVAEANPWLLGALIIASTVALLGTTETSSDPVPTPLPTTQKATATYTFERTGIEGGSVDLTPAAPSATFFVNLRADTLGPHDVVTTDGATAIIDAVVKSSGFAEGATAPFVRFTLRSLGTNGQVQQQALDHFVQSESLLFSGNCAQPAQGAACNANFALDISRLDSGADAGTVHVDWTFDLKSSGLSYGTTDTNTGPFDPPWTVEVVQ